MRPVAAAFVAVAFVFTSVAACLAFSPERSGEIEFWALAGGPPLLLAAVSLAWAKGEGLLVEWLSPRWGDFTRGLIGAAVLFGAAWLFARVVAPVGSSREVWLVSLYGQIGDPRMLQSHAPWVALLVVTVAAGEEIVWRGMVAHLLAERLGSRRAWLYSAALYAAAFVPTLWSLRAGSVYNPVLLAAACGGGLLWGGMARAFNSLVPGILAHALFDWAVIMMFPLWGGRFAALAFLENLR